MPLFAALDKLSALDNSARPDNLDLSSEPNDSNSLRDQLRGETTEHAVPPRLEDEGQSGG